MLSSHRFLYLPLRLAPWTVSCRIVFASPGDRVTCPYYFSLRLFAAVRRSSFGLMAFPILDFTSSLVMWSLCEIPRSLRKNLISNACILLSMSAVMVHVSHAYKNMDMARERISLILELMAMFLSFQMTFSLVTAAVVWAIVDRLGSLIQYYSSQIFKATDGLQFFVVYGVSVDAIGVICHQLGLLCTEWGCCHDFRHEKFQPPSTTCNGCNLAWVSQGQHGEKPVL